MKNYLLLLFLMFFTFLSAQKKAGKYPVKKKPISSQSSTVKKGYVIAEKMNIVYRGGG